MAILNSPLQFISSVPPAARGFTLALVLASLGRFLLTSWFPESPFVLELVPGLVIWQPWTLVTSPFVESGLIELAVSLVVVPISLQYVERLWGALETVKFVLVTVVVSNVIAVLMNIIEYLIIGKDGYFLFDMSYHGTMALQAGVLVALTQQIPEHQVFVFGLLGVRVKRLPMIYVTFSTVVCLLGYQSPYVLIQFGWLVSWAYLRFWKKTGGDIIGQGHATWGDRSETFAFVQWFPPLLHKPISFISDVAYKASTRVGIVKAYPVDEYDSNSGAYASLPGGARAEAERRRAMALKALDQRLASSHNATNSTSTSATGASLSPNQNTDLSPSTAAGASQPPRGEPKPSGSTENPKNKDEAAE